MVEQLTENQRVRSSILRPGTTMKTDFLNLFAPEKLFQTSYLFEVTPNQEGLYKYLIFVFGALILAGLILIFKTKKQDKIWKKYFAKIINLYLVTGFIGLVLIFFRFEGIPYLGSRLFLLLLGLIAIIWLINIIWYRYKILPKKILDNEKEKIFNKYLP